MMRDLWECDYNLIYQDEKFRTLFHYNHTAQTRFYEVFIILC